MRQVFVLSTGRSGTRTLSELLSAVPDCRVAHEAHPLLLDEVTDAVAGRLAHAQLVALLRETRSPERIGGSRLSGESNQRLSFVIPALAEAFPGAHYVWLLRDARAAVASMHNRLWYHPREAERRPQVLSSVRNRLRADAVGERTPQEWQAMDAFRRCCWYWSFTHRTIDRETTRLGLPVFTLRLEELRGQLPRLLAFLDLDPGAPPPVPQVNTSRRAAFRGPLPPWAWSRAQLDALESEAGALMSRFYPGWEREERRPLAGAYHRAARRLVEAAATTTRPLRRAG